MIDRNKRPQVSLGADDKVTIQYPKEPIQIGETKDGKPVWFDPKDLILSPDQKLEQRDNMDKDEMEKALHNMRLSLAARVEYWMALTMAAIIPDNIKGNQEQTEAWLKDKDVNYIEDSSVPNVHKFVLRMGDKVLSEFAATIKPVKQ